MKKFIVLPVIALLAIPALANTTSSTPVKTYESTETQLIDPAVPQSDADMIEAEEESYSESLDEDALEQERMEAEQEMLDEEERMEERNQFITETEDEDIIDYQDRTRTNRERKALNTGSNASDDQ